MIRHQFIPSDWDEDYCDRCERYIDEHANIEGITDEDEIFDFGETVNDIKNRYTFVED